MYLSICHTGHTGDFFFFYHIYKKFFLSTSLGVLRYAPVSSRNKPTMKMVGSNPPSFFIYVVLICSWNPSYWKIAYVTRAPANVPKLVMYLHQAVGYGNWTTMWKREEKKIECGFPPVNCMLDGLYPSVLAIPIDVVLGGLPPVTRYRNRLEWTHILYIFHN